VIVEVKPAKYLTITARRAPGGEAFQQSVGALYGAALALKLAKKFAGQDHKLCHPEGHWWESLGTGDFSAEPPAAWNLPLLIRVPDFIRQSD